MALSKIKAESMNLADDFNFTGNVTGTQAPGIDSSADATAVTINASENVGIGTSAIEGKLTVGVNTTSSDGIYLNNAASGGGELDIASLGTSYSGHGAAGGEIWFYSPNNINIGGATGNTNHVKFLANGGQRMFIHGSKPLINTQNVREFFYQGSLANSQIVHYVDIAGQGSAGVMLIEAGYTHYTIQGYGCSRISTLGLYGGGIMSTHDIQNITSSNGGSWSYSVPTSATIRITKNAGTYIGGGHFWIKVTTYID
tara:strand:- start:582 stop:1349 length:768 start_codon:yes stop_codon:yes gene_type:complete